MRIEDTPLANRARPRSHELCAAWALARPSRWQNTLEIG
jgi:hypothetical protein